jgi:hypothetical protein
MQSLLSFISSNSFAISVCTATTGGLIKFWLDNHKLRTKMGFLHDKVQNLEDVRIKKIEDDLKDFIHKQTEVLLQLGAVQAQVKGIDHTVNRIADFLLNKSV